MKQVPGYFHVVSYLGQHPNEWVSYSTLRILSGLEEIPRILRRMRDQGYTVQVDRHGYCRLVTNEALV